MVDWKKEQNEKQIVLYALVGKSPAVLTELIWALAHEKPRIIPHRICLLTTTIGRDHIQKALFDGHGWDRLVNALDSKRMPVKDRLKFGPIGDHIRLVPSSDGRTELADITSPEESAILADTIMRSLREFTEDPETRLIASLAGGYKTMSALLASCMMLLGRQQDRLVHVLVNQPFDSPELDPPFLFPEQNKKHGCPRTGKTFSSREAVIRVCDVPFVRMRGWYEREYRRPPTSYMTLVRRFQDIAPEPANYPEIVMNMSKGTCSVGGEWVRFSPTEFAVLYAVFSMYRENHPISKWDELSEKLQQMKGAKGIPADAVWHHDYAESTFNPSDEEEIRKAAGRLRRKFREAIPERSIADMLVPDLKKKYRSVYPATKIRGLENL